ncbi:phytoene/squalene synthetase [Caulobacter sp. AP07]|uniref:phytoene/squalene synthase family protein n=1 Tax=Caulobacter sp. AP07 TaxID=1144304 RepID=UPI000271DF02|nr:phytoene/squalene synthase family protein [Caulobacter sp. AP07]EJL28719.1 phytoene/squalene synthetase [Caulobacter sp. AP07]
MTDTLEIQSREAIQKGSKSFAAAAALFDAETRADAEMLYAWCRHCDDVIDGQTLGHGMSPVADGPARLEALYAQTRAAMAGETPTDPVFAAFQTVALRRGIPERYALDMIDGFAMDVAGRRYGTLEDLLEYCWGVAGVVGTMMALVMGVRPDDLPTLRRAQDLGLGFQLTNIARDIVEDARNGRVYVPGDWLAELGVPEDAVADPAHRGAVAILAKRLVDAAEPYYASARWGLRDLPVRSAWAIAAARGVYRQIGLDVVKAGDTAWNERVVVSGRMKAWRALEGGVVALRSATLDRWGTAPERPRMWSRI